jgi:hypothetical protein
MKLEAIAVLFAKDLHLSPGETVEFQNQLTQLFIYNLVLTFPREKKSQLLTFMNKLRSDEDIETELAEDVRTLGLGQEEATQLITDTLKALVAEVTERYRDLLSFETRQLLKLSV